MSLAAIPGAKSPRTSRRCVLASLAALPVAAALPQRIRAAEEQAVTVALD